MNAERQVKHSQVEEISKMISTSKAIVVAEYAGLTVKELQTLRKTLKEHNVELKVYKNRLFKIAAKEAKLDLDKSLIGPNIYAFGMEDDISPAKFLSKFAKEHEALKLKTGTYEGKIIDAEELAIIAALPSYDEALTILAMSMLAPLKNISVGLNMLVEEGKLGKSSDETSEVADKPAEAPKEEVKEEVKEESSSKTPEVKSDEAKASDKNNDDASQSKDETTEQETPKEEN